MATSTGDAAQFYADRRQFVPRNHLGLTGLLRLFSNSGLTSAPR